jgi:hypothetical protein
MGAHYRQRRAMSKPMFDMKVRELAESIYVNLLGSAVAVSAGGVQITTDPRNIAKVSFKLAGAFHEVQDELNAENLPKNQGFELGIGDIEKWNK